MALQNIKIEKEKSKDGLDKMSEQQRPFSKTNFLMMGVCLALIVIGFLLMSGGGSNGTDFNPEVFSTRRIVVGPLLAFLGFLLMAFSIIHMPKGKAKI